MVFHEDDTAHGNTLAASALRAYAINGRRLLLPILVFVLGALLPVITNVVRAYTGLLLHAPAHTCLSTALRSWYSRVCQLGLAVMPNPVPREISQTCECMSQLICPRSALSNTREAVSTRFMLFRTRNENTSLVQVEIITRAGISLSDALVLYATWRATGGIKLLARRLDMEVSLSSLVLTDGTLAFLPTISHTHSPHRQ